MALYIAIRGIVRWLSIGHNPRKATSLTDGRPNSVKARWKWRPWPVSGKGRLYGLEIIRFLEDQSRLVLAEGTIYPILSRLKSEGLLTSEWVEAEAGHPRKYYSLTGAGRERLRLMAEAWTSFSAGLSRLLEPVLEKQRKSNDRRSPN